MNKGITAFPGIIHHVLGDTIYSSKNNRIFISYDFGGSWEYLFSIPVTLRNRIFSLKTQSRRLFRTGVHHVHHLGGDKLFIAAFGSLYCYDLYNKKMEPKITSIKGKRPLSLCNAGGGVLYYGEYCNNTERVPIHVYSSSDQGLNWCPSYEFLGIRHIHGVFVDSYTNAIWVTTGDEDQESGIWRTNDYFKTVTKMVEGGQYARAIQLLFTKDHVYFGSDTPLEKNYIYRLEKKTKSIEKLQEVGSSVFWGCKVGDFIFFSTAVEPSKVNKCRDACIWGSKDGENWKCLGRFRKDIWPMKLFQYGQIYFPSGENNSDYLWFTPFATQEHMTVQRLNIKDIF